MLEFVRIFWDLLEFSRIVVYWCVDYGKKGTLQYLEHLQKLDLSLNQMNSIPLNLTRTLEELKMSHNLLENVEKQQIGHLSNLRSLDLSNNQLKSIQPHAFDRLVSLNM